MAKKVLRKLSELIKENWVAILIVMLFVALHAPRITMPPLDEHSWRQVDTAAVARNFQYESPNILLPRVDIRGQLSGITGMEFPLYNYLLFIFNSIFKYQHWHGRLITLAFSCLGLAYFYALIKRRYSKSLANFSLGVLALIPLYFIFSKNIQPDIMMLAFMMMSLFYANEYAKRMEDKYFYWMVTTLSITTLVKLPAVFVIIPIAFILGEGGIKSILSKKKLITIFLIVGLPVIAWYGYSDYLSKHYGMGNYFYGDTSILKSIKISSTKGFWKTIADYLLPLRFPLGILYFLAFMGFLVSVARKNYMPIIWLGAFIVFEALFAIKGFYHNYYALPLVPPLALLIGIGIDWIYHNLKKQSKIIAVLFCTSIILAGTFFIAVSWKKFFLNNASEGYLNLERIANDFIDKNDLVITNGNVNPIMLYFSNRKGWSLPESMMNVSDLRSYIGAGGKYIIINKSIISPAVLSALRYDYKNLFEDNNFIIFKT